MAKKKRLKSLAAKSNGDDLVQIKSEQSELTKNTNNNDKNVVSSSKTVTENPDGNVTSEKGKIFGGGGDQVLKTEGESSSIVPEIRKPNGTALVDKPVRPRPTPDRPRPTVVRPRPTPGSSSMEINTPPKTISGKQRKLKKETARNKMEQKMNMRMKKIKDPRLIPRMKEYLESRINKNFVSIPLMADYLQQKYPEYGRKKKSMFVQYVDKAYSYMEKPCNNDPPPPLSDTDEDSNTEKELVEENGRYVWKNVSEHSREKGDYADGEDNDDLVDSSDEDLDNTDNLVEYKDTNSINNRLTNMYRNSPTHVSNTTPDEKKRKLTDGTPSADAKRSKPDNKVLYASPNVLERNMSSTGLVGPRRSSSDKYFIDRKGAAEVLKKSGAVTEFKESREVTIQKFLGNLPSRTSFSSYVSGSKDPRLKGGTLYRVFTGKSEDEPGLLHSGITEENVGTTDVAPRSPSTVGQDENETPDEVDPRMRNDDTDGKSNQSAKKSFSSRKDKLTKIKKKPISRQKKGGSSSRNQDMSEPETENGPALQQSSVTFADVGGNESTLIEICKLLVHMRHPEVYCQLGVTPPRGFLLHGPPGCGKTLLANAIAGELDLPLIKLAATEIVSGVSGDSEEKIRGLFDKASQSAPCVVFIDEIDSITPKRETASKDMERRIVAQLLACMDDLNANPGCHVLVIGATNRPDSLDPALRRAGRFDREICLGIPDEASRLRILEVLCRNLRLFAGFDFSYLAHNTPGYVGADLMALTREAAMSAVNRVFQSLQSKTEEELIGKSVDDCLCDDPRGSDINKQTSDKPLTPCMPDISPSTELTNTCSPFLKPLSKVSSSEIKSVKSSQVEPGGIGANVSIPNGDCNSNSADNLLTWTSKTDNTQVDKVNGDIVGTEVNVCINDSSKSDVSEDKISCNVDKVGLTTLDVLPTEICDDNSVTNKSDPENTDNLVSMETDDSSTLNNKTDDVNKPDDINKPDDMNKPDVINTPDDISKPDVINKPDDISEPDDINKPDNVNKADDVDAVGTNDTATVDVVMEINKASQYCMNVSHSKLMDPRKTKMAVPSSEYMSVLRWLKEHPPLSDSQLQDLYITMDDFKEALTTVQPSAKREGFATVPDVTWQDIGALQDVREELQLAILAPVRHREQFKSLGLNRAQGVLLAGPPGCGKTLLAKAVANESGINFISVKGPELLNMYVGESERAVRTVFQRARNSSPCVIFFDELDALCPRRSGSSEGNSSARVVNQLLTEMDGLEDRKQVFIMAATNRPDIIDPAVLRPGRLDKTLYVGLPTAADRLDILKCLTKDGTKPLLADNVNLKEIADDVRTDGYTGADIAALVREASIAALKEVIMSVTGQSDGPVVVTRHHFNSAFNKVRPSVSAKDQEKYSSMRNRLGNV